MPLSLSRCIALAPLLNLLLLALASAFDVSSVCSDPLLKLPATFVFHPQKLDAGGSSSAFLTSSIDLFDVLPLSQLYDRLHWRVLLNGSSTPLARLEHDTSAAADADAWALRLRLHYSTPEHSHLRIVLSIGPGVIQAQQQSCVGRVESLVVPSCVLDVALQAATGNGSVSAVVTQPFQYKPLSAGAAAVAAAATSSSAAVAVASYGLQFLSPITGSSFSSSMPLLVLLHVDFQAATFSSRWTLQVMPLQLLIVFFQ
jgi:hypothetical protein